MEGGESGVSWGNGMTGSLSNWSGSAVMKFMLPANQHNTVVTSMQLHIYTQKCRHMSLRISTIEFLFHALLFVVAQSHVDAGPTETQHNTTPSPGSATTGGPTYHWGPSKTLITTLGYYWWCYLPLGAL